MPAGAMMPAGPSPESGRPSMRVTPRAAQWATGFLFLRPAEATLKLRGSFTS
ncbi:hypothetical protein MPOCJGCO_2179 [Methylobacterium trifolii]|uniref:Uncharacterized protein n=1 Tax=Methylobacterium trifolii TaxID=1003092 RepID=A0ABQ4TYT4_9HYPH|nr:hypothetical protein MPOCJGCO_2179 [Methylobacterium trifolii]